MNGGQPNESGGNRQIDTQQYPVPRVLLAPGSAIGPVGGILQRCMEYLPGKILGSMVLWTVGYSNQDNDLQIIRY